jgi:hypothetical protein
MIILVRRSFSLRKEKCIVFPPLFPKERTFFYAYKACVLCENPSSGKYLLVSMVSSDLDKRWL